VDSIPERDDVQVIVVDDNSDEGKKPALRERKNQQVILLDASQSKGAGRARNVGLKHAEGKWLVFPDSDDYYTNGFLNVLDEYKDRDLDVLYFNSEFRHGKTNEALRPLHFNRYFVEFDGSEEATERIKFHHNVPWTKMVSHGFIRKNSITFEEVPNGNDILFSLLVGFCSTHIEVCKKILYVYNRNENSILTKKMNKEEILCKFTHYIKHNEVYSYLNHPEWKTSAIKFLAIQLTKRSISENIKLILFILCKLPEVIKSRITWVKMLKEKNIERGI